MHRDYYWRLPIRKEVYNVGTFKKGKLEKKKIKKMLLCNPCPSTTSVALSPANVRV